MKKILSVLMLMVSFSLTLAVAPLEALVSTSNVPVAELGIMLHVPKEISDLEYSYNKQSQSVAFSTGSLRKQNIQCASVVGWGPLGNVSVVFKKDLQPAGTAYWGRTKVGLDNAVRRGEAKEFSDRYVLWQNPQDATCATLVGNRTKLLVSSISSVTLYFPVITTLPPTPVTPTLAVDIKASVNNGTPIDTAVTVNQGTPVTLSWTSAKVSSCRATNGNFSISGTNSSAIVRSYDSGAYSITCTETNGSRTVSDSVNINVTQTASRPVITSISPSSGPIGTTITITGTGFSTDASKPNYLSFSEVNGHGGLNAQPVSSNGTTMTYTIPTQYPAMIGDWALEVSNDKGFSNHNVTFTVTNAQRVQDITAVYKKLLLRNPDSIGINAFTTGSMSGFSVDQITSYIMDSDEYKNVHGIATLTGLNPNTGPVGTTVTAYATGLADKYVTFHLKNATGTDYPFPPKTKIGNTMTFVIPTWAKGTYDVFIENADFSYTNAKQFTVTAVQSRSDSSLIGNVFNAIVGWFR